MPLTAFTSPHIPHPHANVLSADAYARGVIRSSTDYQVYNQFRPAPAMRSMQGVDLAFYKHRAFYHTQYDSIPGAGVDGIEGAAKALWAMMEVVRGSGVALAQVSNGGDGVSGGAAAVYFDCAPPFVPSPADLLTYCCSVRVQADFVPDICPHDGQYRVANRWACYCRVGGNGCVGCPVGEGERQGEGDWEREHCYRWAWFAWCVPVFSSTATSLLLLTCNVQFLGSCWSGVSRWVRSGISYWFRFWVMLTVVVGLQIGLIAGYLMVGDKNVGT